MSPAILGYVFSIVAAHCWDIYAKRFFKKKKSEVSSRVSQIDCSKIDDDDDDDFFLTWTRCFLVGEGGDDMMPGAGSCKMPLQRRHGCRNQRSYKRNQFKQCQKSIFRA